MSLLEEINIQDMMDKIPAFVDEHERKRAVLIPALHKIQEKEGFLPAEVLEELSSELDIPLVEIYNVASFYSQYHFTPRGKKIVRVCMGTACHVRGASTVVEALEKRFNIKEGETTEDLKLTLETVGCIGCCGLAPVATVNEKVMGEIGPEELKELINEIEEG
ncbi:MAG: NADH-quinone oxidoreductase subunit NuoE [Nitrospirae bacterium]|nr:MAG: NADH-quinone oxidoreductase subunit NuoE [Nitrospirota bacterium]